MGVTFRAVSIGAFIGAAVAVAFYMLSLSIGSFPVPLLVLYLLLCPPGILFMATAGCAPFDSCSLQTLLVVTALNAILYAVVGGLIWLAKLLYRRHKVAR